jgi:hypothetical protein
MLTIAMTAQISKTITACPPPFLAWAAIAVPATPNAIDPRAMTVIATLRCPAEREAVRLGGGARYPGAGVGAW